MGFLAAALPKPGMGLGHHQQPLLSPLYACPTFPQVSGNTHVPRTEWQWGNEREATPAVTFNRGRPALQRRPDPGPFTPCNVVHMVHAASQPAALPRAVSQQGHREAVPNSPPPGACTQPSLGETEFPGIHPGSLWQKEDTHKGHPERMPQSSTTLTDQVARTGWARLRKAARAARGLGPRS